MLRMEALIGFQLNSKSLQREKNRGTEENENLSQVTDRFKSNR